jgi:hypothetical protein
MDRRGFIKKSSFLSVGMALGNFISSKQAFGKKATLKEPFKPHHFLTLKIIVPSILGSQLYSQAYAKDGALDLFIHKMAETVNSLPKHTQAEFTLLLELLSFRITRFALTGLWRSWSDYKRSEINQAMANWQASSLHLRRMAFEGLKNITHATVYCDSTLWAGIGYPGAPKL